METRGNDPFVQCSPQSKDRRLVLQVATPSVKSGDVMVMNTVAELSLKLFINALVVYVIV